jgi:hypothetical protein
MTGLTDRDLQRIERFVRMPPTRRTPDILVPADATAPTEPTDSVRTDGSGRAAETPRSRR